MCVRGIIIDGDIVFIVVAAAAAAAAAAVAVYFYLFFILGTAFFINSFWRHCEYF